MDSVAVNGGLLKKIIKIVFVKTFKLKEFSVSLLSVTRKSGFFRKS